MKRFMMIVVLISVVAGCGGDAGKGANPGVPVEWNKSPDAPKGYGDPSKVMDRLPRLAFAEVCELL